MTTRQDLRNLCRRRLGDEASPYHWSDSQLNQWINDAIAELAVHLPRKASLSLECEAGVHTYDLPGDFLATGMTRRRRWKDSSKRARSLSMI